MKFIIKLATTAVIALIMSTVLVNNASAFTEAQKKILDIAYVEGLKIGYPETIQAICLQETLAGRLYKIGDRSKAFGKKSYGIMQVKIAAAKDVIRWYPTIKNEYAFLDSKRFSDEELLIKLVTNDRFNIRVGSLFFKKLIKTFKGQPQYWSRSVLAYNRGIRGKGDPNNYVRKVKKHVKEVRLSNMRYANNRLWMR